MLADEMQKIADSRHDKVQETYDKILKEIKYRAERGFYNYGGFYYLYDDELNAICAKLKNEGFEVWSKYADGFTNMVEIHVYWKRKDKW